MGKLSLAAKITHVPSMYLSELPGRHHGCREAAIRGHQLIGERCRALGVDTIVVSDVHWLVNAGYHVNCNAQFSGTYTSNELPHFIRDMQYAYPGNPALGRLIAETATERGIATRAHEIDSLELEYGTLVPMRYMNADQHFRSCRSPAGACGISSTKAGASARRCSKRSRRATRTSRFSRAGRCRTASTTTAAPRNRSTRSAANSSGRSTCAWSSCGSRGLQDLLRDAARVQHALPRRRRDARHRDAARLARLGSLRQARRDRHRLFREFGNRADQCDLSARLSAAPRLRQETRHAPYRRRIHREHPRRRAHSRAAAHDQRHADRGVFPTAASLARDRAAGLLRGRRHGGRRVRPRDAQDRLGPYRRAERPRATHCSTRSTRISRSCMRNATWRCRWN